MNFLEATNADILKVSRKDEFEKLLSAIETVSDYGYDFGEFSENKAVELILAGENLSLDDVEEFATQSNYLWINSEKAYSQEFDSYVDGDIYKLSEFDKMKGLMLQESLIHQLQYDSYKYIGKHA